MEYEFALHVDLHVDYFSGIPGSSSGIFTDRDAERGYLYDMDMLCHIADKAIPEDCDSLRVWMTGYPVEILAVVQVCSIRGISLEVIYYDLDMESHWSQQVLYFEKCPFCGHPLNRSLGHYCPNCGST